MIAERSVVDLALSDLVAARVRTRFQFPFISAEEASAELLNYARLSSVDRHLTLQFSTRPFQPDTNCHQLSNVHVWASPIDRADWQAFVAVVDAAAAEFPSIDTRTSHAARLVFMFSYDNHKADVSSDVRRDFLAPILNRFSGHFSYVDPNSYLEQVHVDEWNPHPAGMPLAWEGEHIFHDRVALAAIKDAVRDHYGVPLRQGRATLLPVPNSKKIPVRFKLMPRFF
ncbi:hypothetical protein FYK55_17085 [Roseiconus nitratireducens]|uniref:Uncharacterized protein n=1 Tax=Roseiconus nitratireducens TaxID=2605748 RepID=A0A5M6D5R0_9BACT|nr:hypothetical protein [Roseiconus nitratireducens]KAA5541910.1 hypothetical protein FYK55_17085 [Roseiconus nitratireducens]